MNQLKNVTDCYDLTAQAYTDALFDELSHKPFDQMILKRFAAENSGKGTIADLGCACGHTTKFLADSGVKDLLGIDLSPEFIKIASEKNPQLKFEIGNMLALEKADETFGAILAFYAIVHFTKKELNKAFAEVYRVLKSSGQFLFSFHVGDEKKELNEFFDRKVNVTFYFFDVDFVLETLKDQGFKIVDAIIRYPYETVEYPSKRAYILAEK